MFHFRYDYCDHKEYLQRLADKMDAPLINDWLWLPEDMGTGYIRVETLPNGLQLLINECTIKQPFSFHRNKSDGNGYTLRFDELKNLQSLSVKVGDMVLEDNTDIYSGAFLTNSFAELEYVVNEQTESRCINIYFTNEWLDQYLGMEHAGDSWAAVLKSPGSAVHFEVLSLPYLELMEEIFALNAKQPVYKTVLQNRVMLLLEKFLRSLYLKLTNPPGKFAMSDADVKKMVQIEALLLKDIGSPPPTITELARLAMMSETKLKYSFKRIYQYGLYEYYQKNRMMRARQMLNSRKNSVKEVGMKLGFKNLSNFSIAFKKEFGLLPSQL